MLSVKAKLVIITFFTHFIRCLLNHVIYYIQRLLSNKDVLESIIVQDNCYIRSYAQFCTNKTKIKDTD